MLSRKTSLLLNTVVISFLMSGSHTTFGKVSDSWEKMASQHTESQKAADAARAEREKELQAIRDSKKEPTSEEKTPLEILLMLFALSGFILDIFFVFLAFFVYK